MDREVPILCQLEDDDLEEIARPVWPDHQDLGRVAIGLEIHDDERLTQRVLCVGVIDAMSTSGSVNLHTALV